MSGSIGRDHDRLDLIRFSVAEQSFGSFDANDLLAMIATWQSADLGAHPRFGGDLAAALGAIRARAFVMP